MPEKTPAQKKAQKKYMEKQALHQVRIDREMSERMKAHAAANGESVNAFITRAIEQQMECDKVKGQS